MILQRVKKTMTSFKLSDHTRSQLIRVRDARNAKFAEQLILGDRLTSTDVIRQLLHEECKRLDEASAAADLLAAKVKAAVKTKVEKKPAKKGK